MSELRGAPIANASIAVDLLRVDLNRSLLAALAQGRMTQSELKARLVLASGSGLHRHLLQLRRLGLVEKRRLVGAPRRVEHGLTGAGEELAAVAEGVEAWLRRHPERPEELAGGPGWRAFLAFNEAWRSSLLGRVAASPRLGRELLAGVPAGAEEKLHRDLRLLTGVGLLEASRDRSGEELMGLSEWCRVAFGLLGAALRWERVNFPDRATPIPAGEAVIGLVAAVPLARPLTGLRGTCTLTVRGDEAPGVERRAGAVWARVEAGGVRDCAAGTPPGVADAWVDGDLGAWFAAVLDGSPRRLRIGGDEKLASALIEQLHFHLFVSEEPAGLGTGWHQARDTDVTD